MSAPSITEVEFRTTRSLRREAGLHDALLFCTAFSAGAVVYLVGDLIFGRSDMWSAALSDRLILSGLIAGYLFLLAFNGWRQGQRGHSLGKHLMGLRVVDVGDRSPTGGLRGLLRAGVSVVLIDLTLAAIPIGLPTALRRLTPESWHVGGVAYVAVAALLIPLLLSSERGLSDRVARTVVVRADGPDARTSSHRSHVLNAITALGVVGVLSIAISYMAYFWPLVWQFPQWW